MTKSFSALFGAIIAILLLLLYTATLSFMIYKVIQGAGNPNGVDFTPGVVYVVTMVGGLVSALVIATLAISVPGDSPSILTMAKDINVDKVKLDKWTKRIVALYITVWMITGLTALLVGVMFYPDVNKTVSDIGTTWLGFAIAAGYSYFGIQPGNS